MQGPVYFDARWAGDHGIGRFALELQHRLPSVECLHIAGPKLSPIDPIAISIALAGKKTGCFFSPGFNPPLRSPIPVIFTIHDLIHLKVSSESTALRRLYYQIVVRPAARRARRILTVSEHSREDIIEWARVEREKVQVVGNGVSAAFVSTGPVHSPGYEYILHVGRRASHKNVSGLLAAYSRTQAKRTVRLMFTGDPDRETCRLAHALGVRSKIVFSGRSTDETLASIYRGARALVFPSLYEGFGLPIIEAMACGTPVITSSRTSTAEIAGAGNALLVEPTNVNALCEAIDHLIADGQVRRDLVNRGLERSRFFEWEAVAQRVRCALESSE